MALSAEGLTEENLKESRLLFRLVLATSLLILAFSIGREGITALQRAYNELKILNGLSSDEYLAFAKPKIREQSTKGTLDVYIIVTGGKADEARKKNDQKAARVLDMSMHLARHLSSYPLATQPTSPLSSSIKEIRHAMSTTVGPYIFEPDYVAILHSIETSIGREFDYTFQIERATWGNLKCDEEFKSDLQCHAALELNLDRYQYGAVHVQLESVQGRLTEAHIATFRQWVISLRPELIPLHDLESDRAKIGMGGYRIALPGLSRMWQDVEALTLPTALASLRKQLQDKEAQIKLFDVPFGGDWAYLAGLFALMLVVAAAALQFRHMATLIGDPNAIRNYPWTILHVGTPTALTLIMAFTALPLLAGLLLAGRGFEARMSAASTAEAWDLFRAHWGEVSEASRTLYSTVLAYDATQQFQSDSVFLIVMIATNAILLVYSLFAAFGLFRIWRALHLTDRQEIVERGAES
jgi:hypothetical protein